MIFFKKNLTKIHTVVMNLFIYLDETPINESIIEEEKNTQFYTVTIILKQRLKRDIMRQGV